MKKKYEVYLNVVVLFKSLFNFMQLLLLLDLQISRSIILGNKENNNKKRKLLFESASSEYYCGIPEFRDDLFWSK